MLRCPKCNRSYQDDMQKFCTHDGGRLVPDFERPQVFDPNATVQGHLSNLDIPTTPPAPRQPAERPQDLNATIAGPLPSTPQQPQPQPPAQQPQPPQQAQPVQQPPPPPQPAPPVQQPQQPPPQQAQPPQQPPPQQAPVSPSSAPTLLGTNTFGPSGETKGLQQQTTRLSQPLPPPRSEEPPAPEPPRQSPPPQSPPPPQQFPTMMAPPTPPAPPPLPPTTGAPFQTGPMEASRESHRETPTFDSQFSQQLGPQTAAQPSAPTTGPINQPPVVTPKKSKLGLVLAVGGVLVLLLLIAGGVGAYFIFIRNKAPKDDGGVVTVDPTLNNNRNANVAASPSPTQAVKVPDAPPGSIKFENTKDTLDGKLAEHYVDFYFYYPQSWQKSPKAGVPGAANFVEVERRLPPDKTQEDLAVSWYDSKGTVEADLAGRLPDLIKALDENYSKTLPEYQKVSEGKTTINGIEGYEVRFKAISAGPDGSDMHIWGRVVYLPPGDENNSKGVTLYMLTTSLAPELQSVDDVGVKGELSMILNSFTLGKS